METGSMNSGGCVQIILSRNPDDVYRHLVSVGVDITQTRWKRHL